MINNVYELLVGSVPFLKASLKVLFKGLKLPWFISILMTPSSLQALTGLYIHRHSCNSPYSYCANKDRRLMNSWTWSQEDNIWKHKLSDNTPRANKKGGRKASGTVFMNCHHVKHEAPPVPHLDWRAEYDSAGPITGQELNHNFEAGQVRINKMYIQISFIFLKVK